MTQYQANRYVCRVVAELLSTARGQGWTREHPDDASVELDQADTRRVLRAAERIRTEMLRRSQEKPDA